MPQRLKGGTVPRRIRIQMPGWRDGTFDLRPGKADRRTYRDWRVLLEAAYREGFFDVLDAVADGELSLQRAYQLNVTGGGGLMAVRAHLDDLAEERRKAAIEGDFPTWLALMCDEKARGQLGDIQYRKHRHDNGAFMDFIVERQRAGGDKAFTHADITGEHWNEANLRAYVTNYIDTHHAKARAALEAKWAEMDDPPSKGEQAEALRQDRNSKTVTANRHVNSIGAFGSWLVKTGRLEFDPAPEVRITSGEEKKLQNDNNRPIMPAELGGLLHWAAVIDAELGRTDGRQMTVLFLRWLVMSGATTWTEGLRVRPFDIKIDDAGDDGSVRIWLIGSKAAARSRFVPVPVPLAKDMLAVADANGGGPQRQIFRFTPSHGAKYWGRLMARIAKEDHDLYLRLDGAVPYSLRHSFAVNALRGGVPIKEVSDLLGHSSLEMTSRYLKYVPGSRATLMDVQKNLGLV